jgi:DNA-binding transcriptional LysR family regulator
MLTSGTACPFGIRTGIDLLAHLETFAAVAEHRSFTAAADQLEIAQPLLSRRIKNLERRLGGELFDRSQRQIRVTELGLLLLPHAQDVISRARHLLSVAEAAQRSAVETIGVPPDCEPAALARVMRTAAQHGAAASVRESPARERAAALAEGRLACALMRVPVAGAALVVPLGLARAGPAPDGRPVPLDSLRPRRADRRGRPPRLLILPEDDIQLFLDRLTDELARAGVAQQRIQVTLSASTAAAEVLAGSDQLVCDQPFARRHGLAWSPLADATLHRGYECAVPAGRFAAKGRDRLSDWLMPVLAAAIGAQRAPVGAAPRDDAPPRGNRDQLAASA